MWTILVKNGTFPSGDVSNTANTTQIAAISAWHFLQNWLQNFPQYNPKGNGLNLFAESYGGKYGPQFFAYFEEMNRKREEGRLPEGTLDLHLESLGIVNGCIDAEIQTLSFPIYAADNPYGVKAISDEEKNELLESFSKSGGCKDQIQQCRALQEEFDPKDLGANKTVNRACNTAMKTCDQIRNAYRASGL